ARREAQKLRFGPWLVSAVSSGRYQGLRWIDPARSAFRIPWKHNARKDVTSSDLEVFKVGGMGEFGRVGIPGTPETSMFMEPRAPCSTPAPTHPTPPSGLGTGQWSWKTNFRCALTSTRMFVLLEDRSKCGDDPHKVY
ncbi:IRF3 factor, partial [Alopecoenas beccarii]|nr:IRF3 factor [Alopecoenas beccarii]